MIDRFPRKEVEMMKVTKLDDVEAIQYKSEKVTEDALQNEHDYLLAEKTNYEALRKEPYYPE